MSSLIFLHNCANVKLIFVAVDNLLAKNINLLATIMKVIHIIFLIRISFKNQKQNKTFLCISQQPTTRSI